MMLAGEPRKTSVAFTHDRMVTAGRQLLRDRGGAFGRSLHDVLDYLLPMSAKPGRGHGRGYKDGRKSRDHS